MLIWRWSIAAVVAQAQGYQTGYKWFSRYFSVVCVIYRISNTASAFHTAAKNNLLLFVLRDVIVCWTWFKLPCSFWPHGTQQELWTKCLGVTEVTSAVTHCLWCLRADLINHPGKCCIRSAITKYLQYTVGKMKSLLDKVGLWLSAQPCCQTAGLAAGAENRKSKYVSLEECAWRLTEVRVLIPTDQNYLETSVTSIPNSCWRALNKISLFKMKAHSKTTIQNDHGGTNPCMLAGWKIWCYGNQPLGTMRAVLCVLYFFPFQPKPFHDWLLLILRKHLGGLHNFVFTSWPLSFAFLSGLEGQFAQLACTCMC